MQIKRKTQNEDDKKKAERRLARSRARVRHLCLRLYSSFPFSIIFFLIRDKVRLLLRIGGTGRWPSPIGLSLYWPGEGGRKISRRRHPRGLFAWSRRALPGLDSCWAVTGRKPLANHNPSASPIWRCKHGSSAFTHSGLYPYQPNIFACGFNLPATNRRSNVFVGRQWPVHTSACPSDRNTFFLIHALSWVLACLPHTRRCRPKTPPASTKAAVNRLFVQNGVASWSNLTSRYPQARAVRACMWRGPSA